MNRLFADEAPPACGHPANSPADVEAGPVEQARVRALGTGGEPFSTFAPVHYERNYAYPLVVWLHSGGGDERQLARVMPLISMRNYVGLSVRGPVAGARRGFVWPQSAAGIAAAEERVCEAVEKVRERFNIHADRIYLAGYESGGTMAYRIALRNPARFAAAASIGGPFPQGEAPLSRLAQLRKFPLLLAHCRDSQDYPIDRVCQELLLFHAAGLAVTLRQYPCGDELTTQMLQDLDAWLMERVTGIANADRPEEAETPSDWN